MIEDKLSILETVMSAVAFDRMSLNFKREPDYKFKEDIEYYGAFKIELVLNYYQLPFHFFDWRNYDQLVEKEVIYYDDIKAFIKLVKSRSRVYLTKETKRDLKFIKNAIELKWDFEQLSEKLSFNLSTENLPYYWFLYHEILKEKILPPQGFLEDIHLAERIQIIANINTYEEFLNAILKDKMNSIKADAIIIDSYYRMIYVSDFIIEGKLKKYEKIIKLNEIFR